MKTEQILRIIQALENSESSENKNVKKENLKNKENPFFGEMAIIRTYNAGVFFGTVDERFGKKILIKNARRMWRWKANNSISLSGCALYGIVNHESKICAPVSKILLEDIEIIECTQIAIDSILNCPEVAQQ